VLSLTDWEDEERVRTSLDIPEILWKKIKFKALELDLLLWQVVDEALELWLAQKNSEQKVEDFG